MNGYQDLEVFKAAVSLADSVYVQTRKLSDGERYGLVAQMRRAAVSVPSNIAEGWGRNSKKDFARFIAVAYGSACELETQAMLVQRLFPEISMQLSDELYAVKRMLNRLRSSLLS